MAKRLLVPLAGLVLVLAALLAGPTSQGGDECAQVNNPTKSGDKWSWRNDNMHYATMIGKLQRIETNFYGDGDLHFCIVPDNPSFMDNADGDRNSSGYVGSEISFMGQNGTFGDAYIWPFVNGAFQEGMRVWANGYWVVDHHGDWWNPFNRPTKWTEFHPLNQLIGQDGGDTPGVANNFSVLFALDGSDRFDDCLTSGRSFLQEFQLLPLPEQVSIKIDTARITRNVGTVKEESHLDVMAMANGTRSSAWLSPELLQPRFLIWANLGTPRPDFAYWPFYIGKFEKGSAKDVFADKITLDVGTCADFGLTTSPTASADTKVLRITWTVETDQNASPNVARSIWALERSVPETTVFTLMHPDFRLWECKQATGATQTEKFVRYYAPGCNAIRLYIPSGLPRFQATAPVGLSTGEAKKVELATALSQSALLGGDYTEWTYGPYAKHSWTLNMRGWDQAALSSSVNSLTELKRVGAQIWDYQVIALDPTTRHLVAKEITYSISPSTLTLNLQPSSEGLVEGELTVQGVRCSYSSWTSARVDAKKELAPLGDWVGDIRWSIRIILDSEGKECIDTDGHPCPWIDLNTQPNKTHDFGSFRASISNKTGDAILIEGNKKGNKIFSFPDLIAVRAIGQTNYGEWPSAIIRVARVRTFGCEQLLSKELARAVLAARTLEARGIWQPDKPFPEHLTLMPKPTVTLQPLTADIDLLISSLPAGPIRETVEDYFKFHQGGHLSRQRMNRLVRFLNLPGLVTFK